MKHNGSWGTLTATLLIFSIAILVVAPCALAKDSYKTLHKFNRSDSKRNGLQPIAGVILDQSGNLYGTTFGGGHDEDGTVFKLTHNPDGSWTENMLYFFCSLINCSDGAGPWAGSLIFDQSGNLYGTTQGGGANGLGTVFKLAPTQNGTWTESVLYSFAGTNDGANPGASLIFDAAGNLYGTTHYGGGPNDRGTVFMLTLNGDGSWTESVLHRFGRGNDGAYPLALIFDSLGILYGTTTQDGICVGGTVFKLTPSSDGTWRETMLHRFCGGTDGISPSGDLIFDAAGVLYGTTGAGGTYRSGTLFELTPNSNGRWTEKVAYQFKGGNEGVGPCGLSQDTAGNLYGTTHNGGNGSYGVVFQLLPKSNGGWKEKVLHTFVDHPGANPLAGVILDATGNLYGTDPGDSFATFGSVFEIAP